jgi:hypothetical protein
MAERQKTKHGHNHTEAFCLMTYETKDRSEREVLWNSRDGVTPFGITSRNGKDMYHVEWQNDFYAPNYKPQVGERIFVDYTPEMARPAAEKYVEEYWDLDIGGGMTMKGHPAFDQMTKQQAVEHFIQEWTKPGSPHVIQVATAE